MAGIEINTTFKLDISQGNLNQLLKNHDGPVGRWSRPIMDQVKREMQREAPVVTGTLQQSISYRRIRSGSELAWSFRSTAPYAEYVRFGTRYMKGNDFMERGMRNVLG
jgi:HK97 gp10 family phage protein